VEVTGGAPLLKTERSDVATTFSEKTVGSLPILNRRFTAFELLTPGVQATTSQTASSEDPQGSYRKVVNGHEEVAESVCDRAKASPSAGTLRDEVSQTLAHRSRVTSSPRASFIPPPITSFITILVTDPPQWIRRSVSLIRVS
jgi:hypothetical protein